MMTQMANPNHLKKNSTGECETFSVNNIYRLFFIVSSTEIFRVFTILYTTKTRRNISFDVFFFLKSRICSN